MTDATKDQEQAVDVLAEMLNKGEINPERLVELAKAEKGAKEAADAAAKASQEDAELRKFHPDTVVLSQIDCEAVGIDQALEMLGKFVPETEIVKMIAGKPTLETVLAAVRKVAAREDVSSADKERAKAKYGDVEYADEKNKKYPVDTEEHIRAAWNYINKPKNEAKYSAEDLKAIKAKIVAAWKKKIDKDGPPSADDGKKDDSKKADGAGALKKGLYSVQDLANILMALAGCAMSAESEASWEGDNSPVPEKLRAAVKLVGDVLKEMTAEEVDELVEGMGGVMQPVLAMADKIDLKKAGARHSKEDLGRVQKMHDTAVELGATCQKSDESKPDTAKSPDNMGPDQGNKNESAEPVKADGVQLKKLLGALSKVEELTKTVETLTADLAKSQTRIKQLEDEPRAPKGSVRAISREQDGAADEQKEAVIKSTPGQHNPAAAAALIKQEVIKAYGVRKA